MGCRAGLGLLGSRGPACRDHLGLSSPRGFSTWVPRGHWGDRHRGGPGQDVHACFWGACVGNSRGGATGGAPAGVFHTPNSLRGTLVTPGSWCPGACWAVPWHLGEGLATCPPERPPQLCRLHGPSVRQMWAAVPTSGEGASVGHCFPGCGKGDFPGGQVLSPSRLPHKGFPWSQRRKPGLPALPPSAHFTLSEDATGGKDLQTKEPGVPATAVWAGKPGPAQTPAGSLRCGGLATTPAPPDSAPCCLLSQE